MAAGWVNIVQQEIRGKGDRVWTVFIDHWYEDIALGPGAPFSVEVERRATLEYDRSGEVKWGSWKMPSHITLNIQDAAGDLRSEIVAETEETWIRVRLEDSEDEYSWEGTLRKEANKRPHVPEVRSPWLPLSFTCGLGSTSEIPPADNLDQHESISAIVSYVLQGNLVDLPIQYALSWRPSNHKSTGAWLADIKVRGPIQWLGSRRRGERNPETRRAQDQLEELAGMFGARVLQGIRKVGTSSQWWFQQRMLAGQFVDNTTRAGQLHNRVALAVNEVQGDTIDVSENLDADSADDIPMGRVTRVEVVRNLDMLSEVIIGRNRFFNGADATDAFSYHTRSGALWHNFPSDHADYPSGNGAFLNEGTWVEMPVGYVDRGAEVVLGTHMYMEAAIGLNADVGVQLYIEPLNPADDPYYLIKDAGEYLGTWTTAPTTNWGLHSHVRGDYLRSREAIPVDGLLKYRIYGPPIGGFNSINITNMGVSLRPKDALQQIVDDNRNEGGFSKKWTAAFETYDAAGERKRGLTEKVEYSLVDGILDSVGRRSELILVAQDVGGDQVPVTWVDENDDEWHDLAGLVATNMLTERAGGDALSSRFDRIMPPEARYVVDGIDYIIDGVEIDLITEISTATLIPLNKSVLLAAEI